jgi:hypothetical protein
VRCMCWAVSCEPAHPLVAAPLTMGLDPGGLGLNPRPIRYPPSAGSAGAVVVAIPARVQAADAAPRQSTPYSIVQAWSARL